MVTIPHKERVLALCDELDSSAKLIGAANLLHFRHDGKIVGHSIDGWAAIKSLGEQGVLLAGKRVCILGGGGAARSLALSFAGAGAQEIVILNRTIERAQIIADEVRALEVEGRASALDESTLRATLPACEILVNATSIGMHPRENQSPVPAGVLQPDLAVYDIVYNPLETRFLREAQAAGARAIDGLGMLIYTNVYAAQACTGHELSAQVMREEALRALGFSS
jgi:shikimate dehydrogenase